MVNLGISSYPRYYQQDYSLPVIDDVIAFMNSKGLNTWRMAFAFDRDATTYVQRFLDRCNHTLILGSYTGNAGYPPGPMGNNGYGSWEDALNKALGYMSTFANYEDRLWLEPANERNDSDLASRMQTIVTAARNAGHAHRIVVDVMGQSFSSMATVNDSLDRFYTGNHYYFNRVGGDTVGWSLSGAENDVQTALSLGLKLMNTEIGADWNEGSQFQQAEVVAVNDFMNWSISRNVGNLVWMSSGLQNWTIPSATCYQTLGLVFPTNPSDITLPYNSTFASLANWQTVNGTWSVM